MWPRGSSAARRGAATAGVSGHGAATDAAREARAGHAMRGSRFEGAVAGAILGVVLGAGLFGALGAVADTALLLAHAQEPTFSTRREIVRVDALVTDRSRPVRDLRAADFEILDSGVPQQVEFVRFDQLPLALVLALDGSVSISPEAL